MGKELFGWKRLSRTVKMETPWIKVFFDQVITPTGSNGIYGVVHYKNLAVGVIPIDEEGCTYIVGQQRYPQDKYSWEIPEGGCPIGKESPLEAVKRELREETGLEAEFFHEILRLDLSNSVSDEEAIVYVATNLVQKNAIPDETENLNVRRVSFSELVELVMKGEITDSMSVAGTLKLSALLQDGSWKERIGL